ncbi:SDR family NAD(P)-dependent oxidoreductase [Streptomyces sp. NBC_00264]|nr:SDR family NAD(P)-dependent oxidoreductase [Streptomyces sp. NBC_01767]MCX5102849.1 SDR family NAD(P)-dependent oxidoreductase [Streptomyces sp. NBC_00439]MCX5162431.1 SDR family NAD(P)-dependent oxidoreductase [Streptomyces sp. NBC_00305]MCX5220948.1 SDR family NAD(P)-dependent oxidoreductase [Streptomyces sp. NBC_00264]WSC28185.1 SDR family NAD(P)-dependent oxidoreductase [Streptomyces sp. NBC_01768]WSP47084.1 SDR family NAD(P)-dependent oxidoreductase [Streptomyces sp. NBC_01243]WSX0351
MKDAFGAPQSLLVLGGTSEIALATARRLIALRTRTVRLAGRPGPALEAAAAELRARGADVRTVGFDALDAESHETALGEIFAEGDIDMVLLAFGIAGDQGRDEEEPLAAVRVAQTNYTGAVSAGLVCAGALQAQGHGSLVVLSSVAGERVRRADFIYGSSKAGLDAFTQGLGDALHGTGVHVMVVRPGLVRPEPAPETAPETVPAARAASPSPAPARGGVALLASARITAARSASARFASAPLEAPSLTTTPDAVAEAIVTGLRRRSETVWVPGSLRAVMSALRHVPRPLFRRLPL